MYKYVSSDAAYGFLPKSINRGLAEQKEEIERIEKFRHRYCNNIEKLVQADEGGFIEGWTLQGKNKKFFLLDLVFDWMFCFFLFW
jgi:hypothetical protein